MAELMKSLSEQEGNVSFEVVIIEDGSTQACDKIVALYENRMSILYHSKPNTGRSDSRNVGMKLARGDYFILVDSDCMFPPCYLMQLDENLHKNYSDCYGGPDAAHESFSPVQKAINYAMTSFFTTGGIRGGKKQMEKFKPRSFNMGFSREVFNRVGGFSTILSPGEDIDLSIRISDAGFNISLYRDVYVFHKRRISFKKFFKQVSEFGIVRVDLAVLHKGSMKIVHAFPSLFLLCMAAILLLSLFHNPCWLLFPAFYSLLIFTDALLKTKKMKTAIYAVVAAYIQLTGYGLGFLKSLILLCFNRKKHYCADNPEQKKN